MSFWTNLTDAVVTGAAGSDNPYLSAAGGLLGGGGGSGAVVNASAPPPPPPPPLPGAPGTQVGAMAPGVPVSWAWLGIGVLAAGMALSLALRKKG